MQTGEFRIPAGCPTVLGLVCAVASVVSIIYLQISTFRCSLAVCTAVAYGALLLVTDPLLQLLDHALGAALQVVGCFMQLLSSAAWTWLVLLGRLMMPLAVPARTHRFSKSKGFGENMEMGRPRTRPCSAPRRNARLRVASPRSDVPDVACGLHSTYDEHTAYPSRERINTPDDATISECRRRTQRNQNRCL